MKKRIISLLLAISLTLAVLSLTLTSCGGDGDEDDTDTPAGTESDSGSIGTGNNETGDMEPYESVMATAEDTDEESTTSSKSYSDPVDDGSVTSETEAENTSVPDSTSSDGAETDDYGERTVYTIKYVALGDSICYGYGLDSPETERYSVLLSSYIDAYDYYDCGEYNYGVNGQTSGELLESLRSGEIAELEDADLVTVSIGANNILSLATPFFISYLSSYVIEDTDARNEALSALFESFTASLQAGVDDFESDLPEIISEIKSKSPNAEIIFQTIYNPFRSFNYTIDTGSGEVSLSSLSDEYITKINNIINSNWAVCGYEVADIYTAFASEIDVVFCDAEGSTLLSFDPHPTAKGHEVIAKAIFALVYLD
ncbi:MAG: GDSL-type esterase/lipase family protein [Firmicutes bacterium]|nr:GDSL-type esterase/lipase family protein [Bacillota bacterium]